MDECIYMHRPIHLVNKIYPKNVSKIEKQLIITLRAIPTMAQSILEESLFKFYKMATLEKIFLEITVV